LQTTRTDAIVKKM